MKVLVFGNVGAGKSSIVNRMKYYFDWKVVSIDDYRKRFGDGSFEKEIIAQQHFFSAVRNYENQFVECLGVGRVSEQLFELLSNFENTILCLKLETSAPVCLSRLQDRVWDIPFPFGIEKVPTLVSKTESRLVSGDLEKLWLRGANIKLVSYDNSKPEHIEAICIRIKELIEETTI